MTPVMILNDIIQIIQIVRRQANLMRKNQQDIAELIGIADQIIPSVESLSALPNNQQSMYMQSLQKLKDCLNEIKNFVESMINQANSIWFFWSFFNAGDIEKKLKNFKTSLQELTPFFNMGIGAQILLNQEQALQRLQQRSSIPERSPSPTGEALYDQAQAAELSGKMVDARNGYHRSCQKGFYKGHTGLGLFQLDGLGGEPMNKKVAQENLEYAADRGHDRAMYNLGRMFEYGNTYNGVVDLNTALMWYERALQASPHKQKYKEKVIKLREKITPPAASTYERYSKPFK